MKDECLICKAPLEYLESDELMECAICHRKENTKTRCVNGHYVCNACHMAGMDAIIGLCLRETSKNPVEVIEKMMALPFCHMHGPEQGNTFTGVADTFPAEYGLHEYGREEEGIQLGEYVIYRSQIAKVEFIPTYDEAVAAIPSGRYRHFKGKKYEVIGIARHSETEEPMVVYRALYGDYGIWVRPASMWNETVERGGQTYRRFYRLDRIERVEKYERLFDEATACPDEEKLRLLEAYYTSGEWREDYESDERGELPPDLKRGVLSQDALYDLLGRLNNDSDH